MKFSTNFVNVPGHLSRSPVGLPLNVLFALPDYVTADPSAPVFNLPSTIERLLGKFGWERASQIMRPFVWAPGWSPEQLAQFATSPFAGVSVLFEGDPLTRIRTVDFPGTGGLRDFARADFPDFQIIHLVAAVGWRNGERVVVLSRATEITLREPELSAALRTAQTRLLILQVPNSQHQDASTIGEFVASSGGPATIVVSSNDPASASRYLTDLYAAVIHNQPLGTVITPGPWAVDTPSYSVDLQVDASYDLRDISVLQLGGYLADVGQGLADITTTVEGARVRVALQANSLRARAKGRVHASQFRAIESTLNAASGKLDDLASRTGELTNTLQVDLNFAHESGGVEPLSRIAEEATRLRAVVAEASALPDRLESQINQIIDTTTRVLNANFADPETRAVVGPVEGLFAGKEYELLVDVGPRWSKATSIVTGHAEFPEEALPQDPSGFVVDVVFMSEDFEPHVVTSSIWLPQAHGRSHAWVEGRPSDQSGPTSLRVKAPLIENPSSTARRAEGRLFLYYENNLLQSALVTVGVVRGVGATLAEPNRINVDYSLTATFNSVGAKFGSRSLRMSPDQPTRSRPVNVNITLNHDGQGTHRIIVRGREGLIPAWTAYDPAAARESLRSARATLLDCFWVKSRDGTVLQDSAGNPIPGLNSGNGKSWDQFLLDLYLLARVGNRLYDEMVNTVRPEGDAAATAWEQQLRRTLEFSSVIQIARIDSTPTQYAYPWALLYEYPLPGPSQSWKFCDVLKEEWSAEGIRNGPPASACKHKDESWHIENVLCPYGFWGLKHVIEQPLVAIRTNGGVLRDAVTEIRTASPISLSIGWTRDSALDLSSIDGHVDHIVHFGGVRLSQPPPNPAEDRDTVRRLATGAEFIYFLCHCDKAPTENQPYLSLGKRDGNEGGKVYGSTITDWARTGLAGWSTQSPLIIINGCHTADIEPGEVLGFVSAFGAAGAAGVIGTDVSVQLPVAIEVGERLIGGLVGGTTTKMGDALREARWSLANKGNLLGMCYAAYGQADLSFVSNTT